MAAKALAAAKRRHEALANSVAAHEKGAREEVEAARAAEAAAAKAVKAAREEAKAERAREEAKAKAALAAGGASALAGRARSPSKLARSAWEKTKVMAGCVWPSSLSHPWRLL